MVGHVEAICQILFGHVAGFVSHSALPRSTKVLSGFWRVMLYPFGCQMQGWKQHFGPRLGPSLAILGPVKVCGSYSYASWGKVGLSGGHVEAELGYVVSCCSYMSDFVRPCCWFCIHKCSPPAGPRFQVGFCQLCWLQFGGQVQVSCGYVGTVGAIGPSRAHDLSSGDTTPASPKNTPNHIYLQNVLPMAREA